MILNIMVFMVNKFLKKITQRINKNEVIKIPNTGHYLFKGEPEKNLL